MGFPKLLQKLFTNAGAGPKLREDIMPQDYLPKSGGAMTSTDAMSRDRTDEYLALLGGESSTDGGFAILYGKDYEINPGGFSLFATNDNDLFALTGTADGNLTWKNKPIATSGDYLPVSGGHMSGAITMAGDKINCNTDASYVRINGGAGYYHGSSLLLTGKNFADANTAYNGSFHLEAFDGSSGHTLTGRADGTLEWNTAPVVVHVYSYAGDHTSGFRFSNGFQIISGTYIGTASAAPYISFPLPFVHFPAVIVSMCDTADMGGVLSTTNVTTAGFSMYMNWPYQGGMGNTIRKDWLAMGRWK